MSDSPPHNNSTKFVSRVSEKIFVGAVLLALPALGVTAVAVAVNSNRVLHVERTIEEAKVERKEVLALLHAIDLKLTKMEARP